MRVIAGIAKGRKLKSPPDKRVRPTADRVKEAIFSMLGSAIATETFIDLFAGSGAIGIEALSRGAERVIFVDNSKKSIALIKENLELTGFRGSADVIQLDISKSLEPLTTGGYTGGIVFMDPPYDFEPLEQFIEKVVDSTLLATDGILIVEHSKKRRYQDTKYPAEKEKIYGDTRLTIIRKAGDSI